MAETTAISWTDMTWSPWEGCTKVSDGCTNCYAAGMNKWLRKGENWGPGAPRRQYSDEHWQKPMRWNAKASKEGRRIKVFPSVCDPFDNEVDPAWRTRFFDLIASTPNLTWLLLTKRIGNADRMICEAFRHRVDGGPTMPLDNIWLGATVVNQEEANRDVPKLLATQACVRFLSVEPMLGPVDLAAIDLRDTCASECCGEWRLNALTGVYYCAADPDPETDTDARIDWVIAGGESGHQARPAHPDWFRSLRYQCAAAGVPFHFKQHGEWKAAAMMPVSEKRAARDLTVNRDDLYVRLDGSTHGVDREDHEAYSTDDALMLRVGKKAAGRLLDGVEHNGFPDLP